MNFHYYIGTKKGESPGADTVSAFYQSFRNSNLNQITTNKNKNDFEELETFLNNMFFPKEEEQQDITKLFYDTLVKSYNTVYDKKISQNFQIDKAYTYTDASQIKSLAWSRNTANVNITNRSLGVMKAHLDEIKEIMETLGNTKEGEKLIAAKKRLDKSIPELNAAIKLFIDEYENNSEEESKGLWENVKRRMILSSKRGNKKLLSQLRKFESFYETIRNTYCATPGVLGDVFEYGLALVSSDWESMKNLTRKEAMKEIASAIKENKVTGSTLQKRSRTGSLNFDISSSYESITQLDATSRVNYDKNEIKGKETIHIGNLDLEYSNEIDVGKDKMGKMDVLFSIPIVAQGKQFRISAKNWSSIYNDKENLGSTSILAGITRTMGKKGSEYYIYTMQHPWGSAGDSIISESHEMARLSLILDIVMGYSQKQGYADTLVILDRKAKRIYVKDIVSLIQETINNSTLAKNSPFIIRGYDEIDIEENARDLRRNVMHGLSKNKSNTYKSLMVMYLNSIKAEIQLKNLTK